VIATIRRKGGSFRSLLVFGIVLLALFSTAQQLTAGSTSCLPVNAGQYYDDGGACKSCSPSGKYHIRVKTDGEIRRSYIWFDISDVCTGVGGAELTIDADYKGHEAADVGVYLMHSWSCSYTPSAGDRIGSKTITSSGDVTFTLNASRIDWSDTDLYLCLAMENEQPTSEERHVDFSDPCIEVSYDPCEQYEVSYGGRSYADGLTTFTYTVSASECAPHAVSHWVLGVPDCITTADIESAGPDWDGSLHTDPATGIRGIKFESSIEPGSSKTFTVTLYGDVQEETVDYAVKESTEVCMGTTTGPACPATADLEVDHHRTGMPRHSRPRGDQVRFARPGAGRGEPHLHRHGHQPRAERRHRSGGHRHLARRRDLRLRLSFPRDLQQRHRRLERRRPSRRRNRNPLVGRDRRSRLERQHHQHRLCKR